MFELMSVEELAEYLRMNPATIYRLAASKKIPGFKIGRHWRFKKDTIDAWIIGQENNDDKTVAELSNDKNSIMKCCICDGNMLHGYKGCSEDGCNECVCRNCWDIKGRKYCVRHTSVGSFKQESKKVYESSESDMSSLAKYKSMEYSFIGRFDMIIRQANKIKYGDGEIIAGIDSWDSIHQSSNELHRMRKLPNCNIETRKLIEKYPLNVSSRYLIPLNYNKKISNKKILGVEALVWFDLGSLIDNVGELAPLGLIEFNKIVARVELEAKNTKSFMFVKVLSPSGWEPEVIDLVVGRNSKKSLKMKSCAICLLSNESDVVYYDKTDSRTSSLINLFNYDTIDEEANAVLSFIEEKLIVSEFLSLKSLSDEIEKPYEVIQLACKNLCASRLDLEIVTFPQVGEMIKWIK